jgi:hypothetical protein
MLQTAVAEAVRFECEAKLRGFEHKLRILRIFSEEAMELDHVPTRGSGDAVAGLPMLMDREPEPELELGTERDEPEPEKAHAGSNSDPDVHALRCKLDRLNRFLLMTHDPKAVLIKLILRRVGIDYTAAGNGVGTAEAGSCVEISEKVFVPKRIDVSHRFYWSFGMTPVERDELTAEQRVMLEAYQLDLMGWPIQSLRIHAQHSYSESDPRQGVFGVDSIDIASSVIECKIFEFFASSGVLDQTVGTAAGATLWDEIIDAFGKADVSHAALVSDAALVLIDGMLTDDFMLDDQLSRLKNLCAGTLEHGAVTWWSAFIADHHVDHGGFTPADLRDWRDQMALRTLGGENHADFYYADQGDPTAADVRDWRDRMALRALGGDDKLGALCRSLLVKALAKYAMQPGKGELGGVRGLQCIAPNQWLPLTTNSQEFGMSCGEGHARDHGQSTQHNVHMSRERGRHFRVKEQCDLRASADALATSRGKVAGGAEAAELKTALVDGKPWVQVAATMPARRGWLPLAQLEPIHSPMVCRHILVDSLHVCP